MNFTTWLAFATICVIFSMTPGPAVILTMSQSMARGFRAGTSVIAGVQLGNLIYFTLSAAGLGAALIASETAFLTIKYAGAAYLVYLGIKTIRNAARVADAAPGARMELWRGGFSQGLVNHLANPKSILFFTAMVPQFIDYHSSHLLLQLVILLLTDMLIEIPVLLLYAATAAGGGRLLSGRRSILWRERLSGAALIGVGGALSLVRRTS